MVPKVPMETHEADTVEVHLDIVDMMKEILLLPYNDFFLEKLVLIY